MKKILMTLILGMFLISFASALELDNVKNIGEDGPIGYPNIEIKNSFGLPTWLGGGILFQGSVTEHTDFCGENCLSKIEINHSGGVLIQKLDFYTIFPDGSRVKQDIRNYNLKYEAELPEYELQCEVSGKYGNGTDILDCQNIQTGTYTGFKDYIVGNEAPEGNYELYLEGDKKPSRTVDWVITVQGKELHEWAIWGNISQGDDAEVILNSPEDNNISFTSVVEFNCSANATTASLVNISLYTNQSGTWELKNTTQLSTTEIDSHGISELPPVVAVTNARGTEIVMNKDATLTTVIRADSSVATRCLLYNSTFSILTTGTYIGANCSISYDLIENTTYYIANDNNGASYNRVNYNVASLPVVRTNLNFTASFEAPSTVGAANIQEVKSIVTKAKNSTTQAWNRTITESTLWTCEACDSDGDCGLAEQNRTVILDITIPQIQVENPNGTLNYNYVGNNETLNVTFTDTNLESCWYNYNGTNISIDGCVSGVKNSTNFILEEDNFNITIYANDSLGNLNSQLIEWNYKVLEINLSFTEELFELESNTISVNVSSNSLLTSASVNFDGVDFITTKTDLGSGIFNFEVILDVPVLAEGSTTKEFFIKYLYNGSFIDSITRNQTITPIIFKLCNSTFNNTFVNFTALSETSLNRTNFTMDATFEYWIGSGDSRKNTTVNSSTEKTNYTMCSNFDGNLTVSSIINIKSSNHSERTFFLNKKMYNNQTITDEQLLLLESGLGTSVIIQVTDPGLAPLEGLFSNVYRFYPGLNEYKIVEMAKSDEFGQYVARVIEPNTIKYQFEFLDVNNTVLKRTDDVAIACRTVFCFIPFVIEDLTDDFSRFENVSNFDSTLSFNNITNTFTYSWNDNTGDSISIRLLVEKNGFNGSIIICNSTSTSLASSLTCDVDSYGDGKYIAQTFRSVIGLDERRIALLNVNIGGSSATFAKEGLFWGFILTATLVAVGSFNPTAGIVLYLIGFIGLGTLEIISMSAPIFFAQVIIGALFIWAIRS